MSTVSVVMPAFNCGRYIGEALNSVLSQTLTPHEVIVIDDGSTDDTHKRCSGYGDSIRYVRQENKGVSVARNAGLAIATGKYIALMDADDLCTPDRFAKQVVALQTHPDAIACYSGHSVFGEGERVRSYPGNRSVADRGPAEFLGQVLVHPITLMFRRSAASGLQFPAGVMTGEDMIFAAQLRYRGPLVVLPDVLYSYRRHATQATARFTEMDGFRQRLEWARVHGPKAWPDLDFADVEKTVWHSAAAALAVHYWARRRDRFLALRRDLRREWPEHLERPAELRLRWYPDWMWRCRGWIGRLRFWRALGNGNGAGPESCKGSPALSSRDPVPDG